MRQTQFDFALLPHHNQGDLTAAFMRQLLDILEPRMQAGAGFRLFDKNPLSSFDIGNRLINGAQRLGQQAQFAILAIDLHGSDH